MLYIIGGTARSGKSILAQQFLVREHVPYFSLDLLMMGLAKGLPSAHVDPHAPSTEVAERMWSIVHVISTTILEDGINYLMEGDSIMPSQVSELSAAFPGQVRSCFIGYESAKPEEMLHRLRENDQLSDDWLNSYNDDQILNFIVSMIRHSKRLHIECLSLAIPYFDISTHFQEIHADILTYLQTGDVN